MFAPILWTKKWKNQLPSIQLGKCLWTVTLALWLATQPPLSARVPLRSSSKKAARNNRVYSCQPCRKSLISRQDKTMLCFRTVRGPTCPNIGKQVPEKNTTQPHSQKNRRTKTNAGMETPRPDWTRIHPPDQITMFKPVQQPIPPAYILAPKQAIHLHDHVKACCGNMLPISSSSDCLGPGKHSCLQLKVLDPIVRPPVGCYQCKIDSVSGLKKQFFPTNTEQELIRLQLY